ncbi:MAG: hypothetical protein U0359_34970 [Byssovorax sp.]
MTRAISEYLDRREEEAAVVTMSREPDRLRRGELTPIGEILGPLLYKWRARQIQIEAPLAATGDVSMRDDGRGDDRA